MVRRMTSGFPSMLLRKPVRHEEEQQVHIVRKTNVGHLVIGNCTSPFSLTEANSLFLIVVSVPVGGPELFTRRV